MWTKLRYFDWDGQVHIAKGKTGGQQGDPLEMLIFNLTVHHIWGQVLAKFQGSRVVAYPDDGYIKGKLSVSLQVLVELKRVLKDHIIRRPRVARELCTEQAPSPSPPSTPAAKPRRGLTENQA